LRTSKRLLFAYDQIARASQCCKASDWMQSLLLVLLLQLAFAAAWIRPLSQSSSHATRLVRSAHAAAAASAWSTEAPLKLDGQPLVVDFASKLGNGSYGSVHQGLWASKQPVVVKIATDDEKHHGKRYLEIEEYMNRKLMKASALVPSTSGSYFAPYVGHVTGPGGAKMLVWRKTGDGTTLRQVL
jgi:hypothetical protein